MQNFQLPSFIARVILIASFVSTICIAHDHAWAQPTFSNIQRPNIVFIAIDTLRADHLGCYGYPKKTSPNIDKFASEGVVFENCFSAASWTLPSFSSMFTGVPPVVHGCQKSSDVQPQSIETFTQQLSKNGYHCSAIVSNPFLNGKYGFGRGFDHYDDFSIFLDAELGLLAADPSKNTGKVNRMVTGSAVTQRAKNLIRKRKNAKNPSFIFIHYFDPHENYIPPVPFNNRFDPHYQGEINGKQVTHYRKNPPAETDLNHLIALYDGEIAYEDMMFGRLLKEIDKCLGDNTIVFLVSDHGEAFGERGCLLHGLHAYHEEQHVPLIWRWPKLIKKGLRNNQAVSTMDIYYTILDIVGLQNQDNNFGISLVPAFTGKELSTDRIVYSQRACPFPAHDTMGRSTFHVALAQGTKRFHAHFNSTPSSTDTRFEVFDFIADPRELSDLFNSMNSQTTVMKQNLINYWQMCQKAYKESHPQDGEPLKVQLTEKEKRRLEGLGYISTEK